MGKLLKEERGESLLVTFFPLVLDVDVMVGAPAATLDLRVTAKKRRHMPRLVEKDRCLGYHCEVSIVVLDCLPIRCLLCERKRSIFLP